MRLFASRAMRARRLSGESSPPSSSWKTSVARCEATSPAFAPPIPSATAKNGGETSRASSFVSRWRPTSVLPACSAIRSATLLPIAIFAVADADDVGRPQPLALSQLPAVEIGPVGRAHVLDIHEAAALEYARVRGRGERILHVDVSAVRAAERSAMREVECRARLVAHRGHHLQSRLHAGTPLPPSCLSPATRAPRIEVRLAGRLGGAGQVAHRAASDPEQEQVEHDEEGELERDRERLVHRLTPSPKGAPWRRGG